MIRTKTVFVLGAGASRPFGFPVGASLLTEIRKGEASSTLEMCGVRAKVVSDFVREVQQSPLASIDRFLERRPEFLPIGKVAIADRLMRWELESELLNPIHDGINWYKLLFQQMEANVRKLGDMTENAVAFVTFNYDRSLEHFLLLALQRTFNCERAEAAEVVKVVPIVHMYGELGAHSDLNPNGRSYSNDMQPNQVQLAAEGIRLIEERLQTPERFKAANDLLNQARRVVFIGFGFDRTNTERLEVGQRRRLPAPGENFPWVQIYAGAMGLGDATKRWVYATLGGIEGQSPRFVANHDRMINRVVLGDSHEDTMKLFANHLELD